MAVVTKVYTPANIIQAPADVYLGVTAPTSASPPTQASEVALDSSGQPSSGTATITGITNVATPVVTTSGAHGYSTGDLVVISGVVGATGANGTWNITVLTTTTFQLNGAPAPGVWSSGGTSIKGVHLGIMEGPAHVTVTEKFNEIMADQFEAAGDLAFDSVEAELDINVKEIDLVKLQAYFMADALSTFNLLANTRVLQFGGMNTAATVLRSLMLIAPNRAVAGKFIYAFAFKVWLKSAVQITFHRTASSVFKLKFGCVADLTRVAGDELLQVVKTK